MPENSAINTTAASNSKGGEKSAAKQAQSVIPSSMGNAYQQSHILAKINESFTSDKQLYKVLMSSQSFNDMLSLIGKVPLADREHILKNLAAVINLNPKLVCNPECLHKICSLLQNCPLNSSTFNSLTNTVLLKMREFLIQNRGILNVFDARMLHFSEGIRRFTAMITAKYKNDFFKSLDSHLLNFVLGKATPEQKKKWQQLQKKKANTATDTAVTATGGSTEDDAENDSDENNEERLSQLIRIMFTDIAKLEPDLVSAVILNLVSQLPYGRFVVDDKEIYKKLLAERELKKP